MALKDTANRLKELLNALCKDLEKANSGNKAAAQRVRTGSIKLEKVAKVYRKESVFAEKKEMKAAKVKKSPVKKPKKK